jgi:hypothetical protein
LLVPLVLILLQLLKLLVGQIQLLLNAWVRKGAVTAVLPVCVTCKKWGGASAILEHSIDGEDVFRLMPACSPLKYSAIGI